MSKDIQKEKIQKLIKKLKLKNEELNALGVMLLISRREKSKDIIGTRREKQKENH